MRLEGPVTKQEKNVTRKNNYNLTSFPKELKRLLAMYLSERKLLQLMYSQQHWRLILVTKDVEKQDVLLMYFKHLDGDD